MSRRFRMPRMKKYSRHNIDPGLEPLMTLWTCRAILNSGWTPMEVFGKYDTRDVITDILDADFGEDPEKMDPADFRNQLEEMKSGLTRRRIRRDGAVFRNVELLGRLVDLNKTECEMLLFCFACGVNNDFGQFMNQLLAGSSLETNSSILGPILGVRPDEILRALNRNSNLVCLKLICGARAQTHQEPLELMDGLKMVLMQEYSSDEELLENFFQKTTSATLKTADFPHLQREVDTMVRFLSGACRAGERGVNILLHGTPGTGKTEMARAVAAELNLSLYEVSSEDGDGDGISGSRRFTSLLLCQRFLARHGSALVLFDECEDVFPMQENSFFGMVRKSGNEKGFTNKLLENNPVPTIWCTNHVSQMDPAFLRRFDLHLEVGQPPVEVRKKILQKHFAGVPVGNEWLEVVSRSEDISPADVERTAKVARHLGIVDSPELEVRLEQVLRSRLQTTGRRLHKRAAHSDTSNYRLDYLNTDCDLERLARMLVRKPSGKILMYGPPGTGKTALAQHLAERIGRPLVVKKASDILSKWVGGTEENIAHMFGEAHSQNAVLLLDEADSFLQDRRGAQRPWEVTQVNELLVQMEEFEGVFICSTNLVDNLDQASFRRFEVKIKFDCMKPEQGWRMFCEELKLHGIEPNEGGTETLRMSVQKLANLTPGDFATVRRKLKMLDMALTPQVLLDMLRDECDSKHDDTGKAVGF